MTVDAPAAPPAPAQATTPVRGGRRVGGRALLVLTLLLGAHLLAVGVVLALVALTWEAVTHGLGAAATKIGVATAVVGVALLRAFVRVERGGAQEPAGLLLTREAEPALWSVVDDVADRTGVSAPDELRLVPDVNAFVVQHCRLLGLVGGRRTLGIGLGLLHVLDVDGLRAVLAHEHGHEARGDTRLGALSYRASETVVRAVENLGPSSPLGRLFGLYAVLVLRTSQAVRRRQELAADAAAAALTGSDVHARALQAVHAGALAWDELAEAYVLPLLACGVAPVDVYEGLAALVGDPARPAPAQDDEVGPYDSHPPLRQRLALLPRVPAPATPAPDPRPALVLLADPATAGRRMTAALLEGEDVTVLEDGFDSAGAHYAALMARDGAALLAAVPGLDGGPAPAGPDRALQLVVAGRGPDLVVALTRDRRPAQDPARDVADSLSGPLAALAGTQLVSARTARWEVSWSGPVVLRTASGERLDLVTELHAALLDPTCLSVLTARWADLGIDLHGTEVVADEAHQDRDELLLVLPDARTRGWRGPRADLLLTPERLVVVPFVRPGLLRRLLASMVYRSADLSASQRRLPTYEGRPVADVAQVPGASVHRWDDLDELALGGGRGAYGLDLRAGGTSTTYVVSRALVDRDELLELLAVLVGDRLRVP